jgi:hypothetical protein
MENKLLKLSEVDFKSLSLKNNKIYLNDKLFKFQSTLVTCLNGFQHEEGCKKTKILIDDKHAPLYSELDRSLKLLNENHVSFLNTENLKLTLNLTLNSDVAFYDDDKSKLSEDAHILSNTVKAYFLFELNLTLTLSLTLNVLQVRIKTRDLLPKGSMLFTDFNEIKKFIEDKDLELQLTEKAIPVSSSASSCDAVQNEIALEINELL